MDDDRFVADLPECDRPNIAKPRWDQSTYFGRAQHFFTTTNPMNAFATSAQLDEAKRLVEDYADKRVSPHTRVSELWAAKHLFDSAFHPDTHDKMIVVGRMSAQAPMNMIITGCMMTFYKTTPAVIFWQWFNQTFNACVNYTNRSGDNPIPPSQLAVSYCAATGGALGTALTLNALVKKAPPLVGRFVPICAVAAANAINIPMMRKRELEHGIAVTTEDGVKLGESKIAAKSAISQVVASRIAMAMPGMTITPFIMNALDKKAWFARRAAYMAAPIQTLCIGVVLVFATPMCCALFPQMRYAHPRSLSPPSSMAVDELEPELQAKIKAMKLETTPRMVYFNKGL